MSDKMKLITGLGMASMLGGLIGNSYPRPDYEPAKETKAHKEYRAERRNKRKQQKKSRKANRS